MAKVNVTKNTYTIEPVYQYDLNQVLEILGLSFPIAPEVHFAHEGAEFAIVRRATVDEAGVIRANVPNSLLQKSQRINAYICTYEGDAFQTVYKIVIPVKQRNRPGDYTEVDECELYDFTAMDVETVALENGADPTVEKVLRDDKVVIRFGLPAVPTAEEVREGVIEATLDEAKNAAESTAADATKVKTAAAQAETAAQSAVKSAQSADSSKTAAAASAQEATEANTAAQEAKVAAEKARDEAKDIIGGDFATKVEAQNYADTAESNANAYTNQKIEDIPTPDVSGQIEEHNNATNSHADIRALISGKMGLSGSEAVTDFVLRTTDQGGIGESVEVSVSDVNGFVVRKDNKADSSKDINYIHANRDGLQIKGLSAPTEDADAANKGYVDAAVGALGAPDYVLTEAAEMAGKVLSHQSENCFTLAWLSDMHIGNSYLVDGLWTIDETSNIEAGQGLHEMSKTAPCDVIALGGDLASGTIMTNRADGLSQMDDCIKYMRPATFHTPTIYMMGNHDDAPWRATADRLTRADIFSRLGRKNLLIGAVTNENDPGCNYGYVDFPNRKMRVIYLDTHDKNGWESTNCVQGETTSSAYMDACNIGAKQLDWFANQALDFSDKENPSEWGVVVLSHTQLTIHSGTKTYTDATSGKAYEYNTDNAIKIMCAYIAGESGTITLNGETVNYDFSALEVKAYLYCHIHGHQHAFKYETLGDKGIPSIGCPNVRDGSERASDDGNTYTKTAGTGESCSFNVITVDRMNGKIYADNYGAGIDREWDVVEYHNYTNLVPLSVEPPAAEGGELSTVIFNGTGYKDNTRISSFVSTSAATGYVTTGIITWRESAGAFAGLKPIYIKGADVDTSKSYVRLAVVSNVASVGMKQLAMAVGGTSPTWGTYFTVEKLGEQYYKLTPIESGLSWYNVQYLRMSLYGTGENLIVTVGEPIG